MYFVIAALFNTCYFPSIIKNQKFWFFYSVFPKLYIYISGSRLFPLSFLDDYTFTRIESHFSTSDSDSANVFEFPFSWSVKVFGRKPRQEMTAFMSDLGNIYLAWEVPNNEICKELLQLKKNLFTGFAMITLQK